MIMSLNEQMSAERVHIGFFGQRNAGKSSLVNAISGQDMSVVSDHPGTTTDPVKKSMELLPAGPVVLTDTPGLDDEEILKETDLAVLVVDAVTGMSDRDRELLDGFEKSGVLHITVYNKADLLEQIPKAGDGEIYVSSLNKTGINE